MMASRFGEFSKVGVTPANGLPAGPFRSACKPAWTCPGVGQVDGVAIAIKLNDVDLGVVFIRRRVMRMQMCIDEKACKETRQG